MSYGGRGGACLSYFFNLTADHLLLWQKKKSFAQVIFLYYVFTFINKSRYVMGGGGCVCLVTTHVSLQIPCKVTWAKAYPGKG